MIVIGDYIINASQAEPVVVTKEVAPIEEVSERSGFYSKTFTILGDAESNKVFNHLFDVNISVQNETTANFTPDFNPNLKASFQYWVDDLVTFEGYCRLDSVNIENGKHKYSLTAFGGNGGFFDTIGEKRLEDLDLDSYNHTYNRTNVSSSWTNDYTDGYVYPMIDYGHKIQRDYWAWTDFRPAAFVKAVWDQIFDEAGWSYESTFLSTNHFEKLIIPSPSASTQMTSVEINDFTFLAGNTQAFSVTKYKKSIFSAPNSASRFVFDEDSGSVLANSLQNTDNNEWDTTNYVYTADQSLDMQFRIFVEAELEYTGASSYSNIDFAIAKCRIVRKRNGQYATIDTVDFGVWNPIPSKRSGFEFTSGNISAGSISTSTITVNLTTAAAHEIRTDDEIYFIFEQVHIFDTSSSGYVFFGADGDWDLNVSAGSLFGNVVDPNMKEGRAVTLIRCMPDWTQRQFVRNIANMFNLYMEQTGDKTILIEPRDEGYLTTDVVDWSEKLAIDRQYDIMPTSELNKKEYLFSFKEGEDTWNNTYQQSWQEVYGEKRVYVDNDFQTDVENVELDFAPTVLSNSKTYTMGSNRVISDMSFYNDDGISEIKEANPRILYWGGMIESKPQWTLTDSFATGGATDTLYSTYPYAGHLDDPITPSYDYIFSFPRQIFYNRAYGSTDYPRYPNRNLYNLYWWRYIRELTHKDSRIFEGYFDLSHQDWVDLSFRKTYFFKEAKWRLVKVSDYDLERGGLTKCKFIKVDAYINPTYDRYQLDTGYGETDDNGDTLPSIWTPQEGGGNKFPLDYYKGEGNIVQGKNGFIYGDANIVGTQTDGFMLMNASGNSVQAPGAVLINTHGREVVDYEEVWINNINQERYNEVTLGYASVQSMYGTPFQLLPSLEDNQYYDVTRVTLKYVHNGTNYVTSGSDIDLKCGDSGLLLATQQDDPLNYSSDRNYLFAIAPTTLTAARDLDDRLGQSLELSSSGAITGNGGDVTFRIYYKIVEI